MANTTNMPRMRTIDEAVAEIKSADEQTAITKNFIRSLVVSGKVPSIKAGRKYLINIAVLQDYLCNGDIDKKEELVLGKIRRITERTLRV